MIDLSTTYMGFKLKNPLIAGSSGMTDSVEKVKKLAEQGIAAVVLKSLFEEQIRMEIDAMGMNNMFNSYAENENYIAFYTRQHVLNDYLNLIKACKKEVDIPVIASINCYSIGEWTAFASKIEEAGADGIELNMFFMPSDTTLTSEKLEQRYVDVIEKVRQHTSLPLALKVSTYFSGMGAFLKRISESGIQALVLFNRFYSPDVDLEKEELSSSQIFSRPEENANCLRWIGILSPEVSCNLAASTGIKSGADALKNILMGADAVQIASALYQNKSGYVSIMLQEMEQWMEKKNYSSISAIRAKLAKPKLNQEIIERAQFMKYYSSYE